jgi:hypothetical protein
MIAKQCELMSIRLVYYWTREIYPLENGRGFNIPTGETELTPKCSRSAKRSYALLFKMVVVAYESDLGRMKLNWGKRFTNMYQRSW